ncbi:hypothetical protein [Maribacter arcticus]|uniref:hypothetical protein n=1 Tax=Maribacter arcticus TaxID=561365 RepID=UPI0030D8E37D|tara:strand:+ start:101 stop:595 length:495 start_codon:yes stop_codon:yes gene_type:complete
MQNYFKQKGIILVLYVGLFSIGCQSEVEQKETPKTSNAEIENLIKKHVDSLYSIYDNFGYEWIEFYDDTFTSIYPETPININSKDSLKSQWKRIYDKYDVKLISRGEPTVITSEDMAMSYNSFNEIFIEKISNDTIKNIGTYIITWKRQPDDSWKIVFETLHNN